MDGPEVTPKSLTTDVSCSTGQGIFSKVFRRLSFKRKSSKGSLSRSKGSQSPLDGCGPDGLYSEGLDPSERNFSNTFFNSENENLYRGVLQCLLHPLGTPDTQIGLRPGDLIDHIRRVFDVDHEDHEVFIREELQNKPKRVQATVTVLEARDLKDGHEKHKTESSLYCLLTMVQPSIKMFKSSPKTSPKNSPKSSPKMKRPSPPRSPSFDSGDVLRTQPTKGSREVKWNEEFQFEVIDPWTDEIHLCICHHDETFGTSDSSVKSHSEKTGTLKGFFKNILQTSSDHDRLIPGCVGRVILPVRDVSSHGLDGWLGVYPVSGGCRSKPVGECHLRVTLSYKQDGVYGATFTSEDYHLLSLLCYKRNAKETKVGDGLSFSLDLKSRRTLDTFAVINGISKLSQTIMELTVLLEMASDKHSNVTDCVLHKAVEEVQMTWVNKQVSGQDYLQRMPLTDGEICVYRTTTRRYIAYILQQLHELSPLFPPFSDSFALLKQRFGIAQHLLELDLWDSTQCPKLDISKKLLDKLQSDVRNWVETNLKTIESHDQVKDAVIPEVEALVKVFQSLTSHCTPLGVVSQFYLTFDVNYYRIVSFETERRVVQVVRELMLGLDKYQVRYHKFPVNIETSSRLSLNLFFSVRHLYLIIRDNLAQRDTFRLTISKYQDWFQESLVFWLQTFRTECMARTEKALEIDKDLVVATSLVKFSHSSVDVLSCFAKITEEWRQIGFQDADSATMAVTKLTDLICDGARMYADKVHCILERNCYYDLNQDQFDVTDRLCITLNNIEHVRQYLNELPHLLDWNTVVKALATRHESARVGKQAMATLSRLVTSAHADILLKSSMLLRDIAEKMKVEINRSMEEFLIKNPEKSSSTDATIAYLDTNLQTLHGRLSDTIYPNMIMELWDCVLCIFYHNMLIGKEPSYYEHLRKHLRNLSAFFTSCGLESEGEANPLLTDLCTRLRLNCMSTQQLMLEYYNLLGNCMGTPVEYLGHLALKVAYMEETLGNVTIFVKVIRGCDLPMLDRTGSCDPYVTVSLQPASLFNHKPQKTKTICHTVQPIFNTTFQFPNVPKEYLTMLGAVLLLSVFDYDRLKTDDFAGEVVIHLANIPQIFVNKTVDSTPVVMMPLKQAFKEAESPFTVLQDRSSWDTESKAFIQERMKLMKKKTPQHCESSRSHNLTNLFSFFTFGDGNNR